ncbi:DUF4342 domain-containing protein [Clostridium botulinum]|uniref:DUF4342 domain-containing protein n=1 Tax=Clostridium botulinum TaxID=1491 RepID=UPI001A925B9D|nr:DUF4342 domain-containing protein [Clostridium botulinum]MBO0524772.1 DUF4342 domain-containing protein [Clostridium botulinum]MBO0527117.1 DUF4342 domain-containing protein [Clostridium botulinum]MBO0533527.1 DUF4342 domain-containing protein [Clostridium botulinum]MBO0536372.1 DUF4342 domain-containing protein [Clostridium botulinum]MBO0537637.1 DUF4342 domain-containing protein [Clostridium botulinum]
MNVSLEQIDLLRKRANVSYEEAKEVLEKFDGDIIEALVYLEKNKKVNEDFCCESKFFNKIKMLIRKGNKTKVVVRKKEETVLKVPVNVVILCAALAFPVTIAATIIALVTKHTIRIEKNSGENSKVNDILNKVSTKVNDIVDDLSEEKEVYN